MHDEADPRVEGEFIKAKLARMGQYLNVFGGAAEGKPRRVQGGF
jgi:hypothetical protein